MIPHPRGAIWLLLLLLTTCAAPRGTGDLGLVIERSRGSVLIIEHSSDSVLHRIAGLGDLSHASVVYSRDGLYGYVFGRDGGLSKVDLLRGKLDKRIKQAGNSIGGAISQDGRLIAVSNYEPGGVRIFRASDLSSVVDLPAIDATGRPSRVVGLVDAPGQRFVFSLMDADEIWVVDASAPQEPTVTKFTGVGRQPYDALITPDGRHYVAGLFGEDGLVHLDLWNLDLGTKRILSGYGRGKRKLPVYKMPHLEGWAIAGEQAFLPAVGAHELLVVDTRTWQETGRVALLGQPVFAMAEPGGRHIWVNFAFPDNDRIQVVDSQSQQVVQDLAPGKGVLHMEFTPRGEKVWVSLRDEDRVEILRTSDFSRIGSLRAAQPSGIFFTVRSALIGL